jgi:hypothetical protein
MIMPEIRAARFFARIPRLIPGRLFNAVKLDSRIWNAACSLLRGETTYTAIENRVRSLGGLYRLLRFK